MVLQKLLRLGEGKHLKQLSGIVGEVNAREPDVVDLSDEELFGQTSEFKRRLADGETLDDLLPEAFATVREVAKRVLGQRPFDVQILGGIALHQGNISEMRTGEGKTLTSTMPVYLNALGGSGVHVVTVNPYLASRDAAWMGQVYERLGLSVGLVYSQQPKTEKRAAYAADVTYGTNNEFGFDFLRDHMVLSRKDKVQRGHHYAIVDEVDSILVDEARTPLIISGPADQATEWYTVFARRVAPRLRRDEHYEVDEAKRTVAVTEEGVSRVEELLGVENLYESVNTPLIHHLQNAIRAKELYRRDDEYIVEDGEVHIVDEFTGRILHGRRYSEGLHQAIEAKEGVRIKEENQTLATITLQNYFRQYTKLCGMTGTAKTEEGEFAHIYSIGVVVVPTNRDLQRADHADLIYKTEQVKLDSVVEDLAERQARGQPVLVGTVSVEKSERLSAMLRRRGLAHEVLNAKNHFREAEIVAQAGRPGAITVATNMAGRGVDIMLGGNPEALADAEARREVDPNEDPEGFQDRYLKSLEKAKAHTKEQGDLVRGLGGLYVLGTERHESRRIDNQLRGRSGRQGDPGESRFYLSLEDDLMRLFNASAVESIMTRLKLPEDLPIEAKMVSRAVQRAQSQVEARNFEIRKNVLKYDDVMNKQREVIYGQRSVVLEGPDENVAEYAEDFIEETVRNLCATYTPEGVYPEEWSLEELWTALQQVYDVEVGREDVQQRVRDDNLDATGLTELILDDAMTRYEEREKDLTPDVLRAVERRVILSVVDRVWREHLYEMDHLREGIGLRAVGQRDPLVEYQREAYAAFAGMMARIKEEAAGYFFRLPVQRQDQATQEAAQAGSTGNGKQAAAGRPKLDEGRRSPANVTYTSGGGTQRPAAAGATPSTSSSEPGGGAARRVGAPGSAAARGVGSAAAAASAAATAQKAGAATSEKVGRNDPCPCGSGLKYKKCHGQSA
ncbi:MAG: preprotein translocase subunit SecA [Nitriliruptorales bacterium]|nr:preprotein translocase subunit SecA [Nitriliruptorales bacterium]